MRRLLSGGYTSREEAAACWRKLLTSSCFARDKSCSALNKVPCTKHAAGMSALKLIWKLAAYIEAKRVMLVISVFCVITLGGEPHRDFYTQKTLPTKRCQWRVMTLTETQRTTFTAQLFSSPRVQLAAVLRSTFHRPKRNSYTICRPEEKFPRAWNNN